MKQKNLLDYISGLDPSAIVADLNKIKEKNEAEKPKKTKKKRAVKYKAPFQIYGEFVCIDVTGEEEYNDQEITEMIVKKYPALDNVLMTYEKATKTNTVKVYFNFQETTDRDSFEFPLRILNYEKECLNAKSYDSYCKEFWLRYPHYSGCKFQYCEYERTLIPFHNPYIVGKKFEYPLSVGVPEQEIVISEQTSINKIRDMYVKQYPDFEYCTFHYISEENHYYPIFSKEKKDLEIEYIGLPIRVLPDGPEPLMIFDSNYYKLALGDNKIPTESELFVSLEELIAEVKEEHPVYCREQAEIVYDERGHYLLCTVFGGTKGIVQYEGSTRIEDKKFGVFKCDKEDPEITPDFGFSVEKIPKTLLDEAVKIFKETPEYESVVNIFYDPFNHTYFLYRPKIVSCSRTHISYERNSKMEGQFVFAMDIHSHGYSPAFFSETDDQDEVEARLYGVVGNLNQKRPSVTFRAGIFRRFKTLSMDEIFI